MYRVIRAFYDLTDYVETKGGKAYHFYREGDDYPRKGVEIDADRVTELSGSENRMGEPLIEEVKRPVRTRKATK